MLLSIIIPATIRTQILGTTILDILTIMFPFSINPCINDLPTPTFIIINYFFFILNVLLFMITIMEHIIGFLIVFLFYEINRCSVCYNIFRQQIPSRYFLNRLMENCLHNVCIVFLPHYYFLEEPFLSRHRVLC